MMKLITAAIAVGGMVALSSSCSDGGDGDAATATVFDTPSVLAAVQEFEGLIAICQDTATAALKSARRTPLVANLLGSAFASASPTIGIAGLPEALVAKSLIGKKALTSVPPPDELGNCGGRFGFRDYSHQSGVTTAKLSFEDYCLIDPGTGERQRVSGSIAFVNTATPTASGPITTGLQASTVSTLSISTQTAAGALLSAQSLRFSDFKMLVGVPGGLPTASAPNVLSVREIEVTNSATAKTYRHVDYAVSQFQNDAGQAVWTMTGRGYRSDGTYFDIVTTRPVLTGANAVVLSGQVTLSGANGSQVVADLMSGPTLAAALTINGTPVTSAPSCFAE